MSENLSYHESKPDGCLGLFFKALIRLLYRDMNEDFSSMKNQPDARGYFVDSSGGDYFGVDADASLQGNKD